MKVKREMFTDHPVWMKTYRMVAGKYMQGPVCHCVFVCVNVNPCLFVWFGRTEVLGSSAEYVNRMGVHNPDGTVKCKHGLLRNPTIFYLSNYITVTHKCL